MPKRIFIPGENWLYYKLYTGRKTADKILVEVVKPFCDFALEENQINKWFFIRYVDPEFHLRIRFHFTDLDKIGGVMTQFCTMLKPYLNEGMIWKIQLDSYQRELERYGSKFIEAFETIFYYDSHMVVNFIALIEGEEGEELRWLFGIRAIDQLLSEFGLLDHQKLSLLDQLKTSFGKEFNREKILTKQLSAKYRKNKDKIERFISFTPQDRPELAPLIEILNAKNKASKDSIQHIISNLNPEEISGRLSSTVHMFMNRLFRSKNRLHEMVIYDLLFRHYKSDLGKRKFTKIKEPALNSSSR